YIALGDAGKEARVPGQLHHELWPIKMEIITIHEDNMGTLHLASNKIFSAKTKHIHVRYHFLKLDQEEKIHIKHVASSEQLADILTKPLPSK
ncbi:unnamed protein product, partial [Discosporangium mesarthrocarpum]